MFYKQLLRSQIPLVQKNTVKLSVFFELLGVLSVKAARRALMQLTLGGLKMLFNLHSNVLTSSNKSSLGNNLTNLTQFLHCNPFRKLDRFWDKYLTKKRTSFLWWIYLPFSDKWQQARVDFTNVLWAAFTRIDPKSAKRHWWLDCFFALLEYACVNASHKTLVKFTPGELHMLRA